MFTNEGWCSQIQKHANSSQQHSIKSYATFKWKTDANKKCKHQGADFAEKAE